MPTYGYRCTNCGHQFEVFQRMSDEPLKVCPECQGALRKVVYATGVVFKGSGFYTTDYKSSGSKASDKADNGSSASGDGASSSSTKPETKAESKSESKSSSDD